MRKKEEAYRTYFANWIKNSFITEDIEIYYDSKQISTDFFFQTKGSRGSRPDIIIRKKLNDSYWNIAVEFKNGKSSELTDAFFQIQKYRDDYERKKTSYYIGDEQIKLHSFVIASANSPTGFLFDKEASLEKIKRKDLLPDMIVEESPQTFLFWRILYRIQQKDDYDSKLGIIIGEKSYRNFLPFLYQENKRIPLYEVKR